MKKEADNLRQKRQIGRGKEESLRKDEEEVRKMIKKADGDISIPLTFDYFITSVIIYVFLLFSLEIFTAIGEGIICFSGRSRAR